MALRYVFGICLDTMLDICVGTALREVFNSFVVSYVCRCFVFERLFICNSLGAVFRYLFWIPVLGTCFFRDTAVR